MHCSVHAMICTYIRETLISNKTFSERNISSQFEMSGPFSKSMPTNIFRKFKIKWLKRIIVHNALGTLNIAEKLYLLSLCSVTR